YTRDVADYLAKLKFEDLPEDVVDMAKRVVLDFIGYSIVAIKEEPALILYETVKELGGREESTIIGFGYKTTSMNAALVNGALGHMCELDDTHLGSQAHIGDSVIPTALAVAEREGSDGQAFIAALTAGYEIANRVGKSVMPTHYFKGWHPTGTFNTFGTAVAAGKLLD
ncbi:MAG: MmgE/PrpD family protein, partial [Nitrososphaeria archaeon]|nr:MmgE/PrpD family protein [Nitrososphaeria archaeon]